MDPNGESMRQASSAAATGGATGEMAASSGASTRKIRITFDRYMEITSLVVLRINEVERQTMRGVLKSELVDWYLLQRENEMETVEQFEEETELIKKVLTRLVKDSYLLEIRDSIDDEGNPITGTDVTVSGVQGSAADPVLMVHPQVDIDSIGATTSTA